MAAALHDAKRKAEQGVHSNKIQHSVAGRAAVPESQWSLAVSSGRRLRAGELGKLPLPGSSSLGASSRAAGEGAVLRRSGWLAWRRGCGRPVAGAVGVAGAVSAGPPRPWLSRLHAECG
jgi:hypothetical protein